jgi:hypothetical protein
LEVVLRILVVIMLVVTVAQARGVQLFGDDCYDDDCGDFGKSCPPECPTCTCASAPAPSVAAVYATLAPPILTACEVESTYQHVDVPSPDPREILHVPRTIAI